MGPHSRTRVAVVLRELARRPIFEFAATFGLVMNDESRIAGHRTDDFIHVATLPSIIEVAVREKPIPKPV